MNPKFILYSVGIAAFLGPFTQTIYTPILPEVVSYFQSSSFLVNLTISIFTFMLAVMQMVYGPLVDRKGRKKILLAGIAIYIAASAGCFVADSIGTLIFFRALQAIGIAAGSVVAVTVIGDLFEGKERGRAMGTFQMLVSLGPVLGPVIGGWIGSRWNFHFVFFALAISGLIVFLLNLWIMRETGSPSKRKDGFSFRDFKPIVTHQVGSSVLALGFIQYYTFYNFLVFLPDILKQYYHLEAQQIGLIFLPMSLCIVIGSFAGGRIQERMEQRQFLLHSSLLNVLAIIAFVLSFKLSLYFVVATIVIFGLFLGVSLPVQTTLLTQAFLSNRGTAVGAYNFFRFLGMAAGPMLGSILYELGGTTLLFSFAALGFSGCIFFARKRMLNEMDALHEKTGS